VHDSDEKRVVGGSSAGGKAPQRKYDLIDGMTGRGGRSEKRRERNGKQRRRCLGKAGKNVTVIEKQGP